MKQRNHPDSENNQPIRAFITKNHFLLHVLITGLGLTPDGRVTAQTFRTLHSFAGSDGANPQTGLILSSNTLYGTASGGGGSGNGTVFKINTDGTGFTSLHSFTAINATAAVPPTNSDGSYPEAGLILSGSTLYGTAACGGAGTICSIDVPGASGRCRGAGTVFAVNTDGTAFITLHSFNGNGDGASPSGLLLSGNTLYGTAYDGGDSGVGTVFKVNTDGADFTVLHSFSATSGSSGLYGYGTNLDGGHPQSGLILSGNTLYGTTTGDGSSGNGTVFAVDTDGTGFRTVHTFTAMSASFPYSNSDGAGPSATLISSTNILYGTANQGGNSGNGTVFKVNTDGTGFTTLYSFTALDLNTGTNSDGANPRAGLILSGSTLYGTAGRGGSSVNVYFADLGVNSGNGTVFAVNTDGTGFTVLHSFAAGRAVHFSVITNSDGAGPSGALILSGNTLYGTTAAGGSSFSGTVFSLSLTPQLTIIPSTTNLVLTWSTNYAGFDYSGYTLQSTTTLGPTPVWTTNSPAPVIVNGQSVVTNPISVSQQFFRLSH
jgi:uncharacterized repeat protein (TIGR03803 family)